MKVGFKQLHRQCGLELEGNGKLNVLWSIFAAPAFSAS